MSEELLVRCCAPTLASIKTGNMFTCRYQSVQEMTESIRDLNRRLRQKGLRIIPLRYRQGVGLIYVYRPCRLQRDLNGEHASRLLKECGYHCKNVTCCLQQLRMKLEESEEFPHEIGLFLGYPPEDVDGFMHRKAEAKLAGHWKVYGDVSSAERIFALYKKCTSVYLSQWAKGSSIERLTVAA